MSTAPRVRVAFYGCGNFANRTRIPNLLQTNAVDIVAACDSNLQTAQETATHFKIPSVYQDAHEMLDTEAIDVLYSIVPAYVRADVEVTAAEKGIHIFSEKPQAITMAVAYRINDAIQQAGVLSTVGFRERYRPIFQEARRYLTDKQIVHVRFQSFGGLPAFNGWRTQNMVGRDGQIRRPRLRLGCSCNRLYPFYNWIKRRQIPSILLCPSRLRQRTVE